jgi:hypothetical protein
VMPVLGDEDQSFEASRKAAALIPDIETSTYFSERIGTDGEG